MGHITSKSFWKLQQRLNKAPQGLPVVEPIFEILKVLFSEEEAGLVSVLPTTLFSVSKASKIWKKDEEETEKILDGLAAKGILCDFDTGKGRLFGIFNPMPGFIENSLMRTDGKFNTEILAEFYYEYINKDHTFVKNIFGLSPPPVRTFVQEQSVEHVDKDLILDYERASNVIDTATCITVGRCYCRHKMEHLGKHCDAPQDVCLTFNNTAKSLSKHGIAKEISKDEARAILDRSIKHGLVQIGNNVQDKVGFMCNCCGCCCEALLAYKTLGYNPRIHTNFLVVSGATSCTGCKLCELKCPVDAIKVDGKSVVIDVDRCIGCGVCCRLFVINLSEEEYKSKRFITMFDEFVPDWVEAELTGANLLAQNDDGSCVYLKDNKCSIHENRPIVCRPFFCDSQNPKFFNMISKIKCYKDGYVQD